MRGPNGEFQYKAGDVRPTLADRQRSAVETQPPLKERNTILEDELERQGIAASDEQRAILRRWGKTLTELGGISAKDLGRNVPTEAEIARAAVDELATRLNPDGTYIQARYDAFVHEMRDACLAAVVGVSPEALRGFLERGEALPAARTPAEQRAAYDKLYATLPDNQSRGELWSGYRDIRGRLPAAQGGFEGFSHLPLTAGHVLQHTPETRIDGAIKVTCARPRTGASAAGALRVGKQGWHVLHSRAGGPVQRPSDEQ